MKKLVKILKRWYYRRQYSPSSIDEMFRGKFKVIYPDGKKSVNMFYRNAKNYAEIFNGKVIELF